MRRFPEVITCSLAICGLFQSSIAAAERVVYIAEQDIAFVPELYVVDTDRPGRPVKLNSPLTVANYGVVSFDISPDGQYVIYTADQDTPGDTDLYLVPLAAPESGIRLGSLKNRLELSARFSPDGKKVAVSASNLNYDHVQLFYIVLSRPKVARRISSTSGNVSHTGFQFTTDSRGLIFTQDADRPGAWELYLVRLADRTVRQKLNPPLTSFGNVGDSFEGRFALTGDGSRVVYSAAQETQGVRELFAVELSAPGVATRLNGPFQANGDVTGFVVAPDGRYVAYSADQDTDGVIELYLVDLYRHGRIRKVSSRVTFGAARHQFTPDSQAVVFSADARRPGLLDLYAYSIPEKTRQRLNKTLYGNSEVTNFAISHDSSKVVYYTNPGTTFYERNVMLVDMNRPRVATRVNQKITKGGLDIGAAGPEFSPDDESIAFVSAVGSTYELYSEELADPPNTVRLNAPLPRYGTVRPATYKNSFAFVPDGKSATALTAVD